MFSCDSVLDEEYCMWQSGINWVKSTFFNSMAKLFSPWNSH